MEEKTSSTALASLCGRFYYQAKEWNGCTAVKPREE
jgi:hypothetical protein